MKLFNRLQKERFCVRPACVYVETKKLDILFFSQKGNRLHKPQTSENFGSRWQGTTKYQHNQSTNFGNMVVFKLGSLYVKKSIFNFRFSSEYYP